MPPWMAIAFKDMTDGVREIPGSSHHARILEYHLETSMRATEDEVPWCSAALCAWFEESGIPSTRSAAAKSWLTWGQSLSEPREGCVVILSKAHGDLTPGHVGLYVDRTVDKVKILGGNQGDRVSIAGFHKLRVLGYRWPHSEHYRGDINVRGTDNLDS